VERFNSARVEEIHRLVAAAEVNALGCFNSFFPELDKIREVAASLGPAGDVTSVADNYSDDYFESDE